MRMLLGCLLAVLVLAGCSSSQIQGATKAGLILSGEDEEKAERISQAAGQMAGSFAPIPFDRERTLGGGIAVKSIATEGRLYPNDALQRYVNLVGLSIVRETPRNGFPFNFGVVDNEGVNAWAAPGGYIFVTSGAVKHMEDEAQLAAVLGHEIAHVTEAHLLKMMKRQQFFGAAVEGAEATVDKDLSAFSKAVDLGTNIIFDKGYDRNMEYEADEIGVEFAALTGYDPSGLSRYLKNLQRTEGNTGGGWLTSTHPELSARIERLDARLNTELAGIEGAAGRERFQRIAGAAFGK